MQFSYYTQRQNIVKNALPGSETAQGRLRELLDLPFSNAMLRTMTQASFLAACECTYVNCALLT